jgi:hypothetical protein
MRAVHRVDLHALRRRDEAPPSAIVSAAVGRDAGTRGLKLETTETPRDEAAFWLTAAAEIEHALMVQYLFAAYTLNPAAAGPRATDVESVKRQLLQIAREEMGHLITVENLLLLIGAPLHLGREHSPFASEIYPFRFKLERLTLDSLAKYVLAESPDLEPEQIPSLSDAGDRALFVNEIKPWAVRSNDGEAVKHVGPIYHRLRELFEADLDNADFRLDRAGYQARWADWGFEANSGATALEVLVRSFEESEPAAMRAAAVAAIIAIGDQGEASDMGSDPMESHFERFFSIYKTYKGLVAEIGRVPTWPVVRDPNTSHADEEVAAEARAKGHMVEAVMENRLAEGRIRNERTRRWAELFNLRYRLLLGFLLHGFARDDPPYAADGDRTAKGLLQYWTFSEMRRVKKIAEKLVQMPKDEGGTAIHAGPPFELPYTLSLPPFETDRWRTHADVLTASLTLAAAMRQNEPDASDPFLQSLLDSDGGARRVATALAAGAPIPPDLVPSGFMKTLTVLEEAVRGFDIQARHNASPPTTAQPAGAFWRGRGRDDFLALKVWSEKVVVAGEPDASGLLRRIELPPGDSNRMPRHRPRIPQERIDYVRAWIAAGAPDDAPPSSLAGEPSPSPETAASGSGPGGLPPGELPLAGPSFERDIKPLFRDFDRASMLSFGLDLHDYQQVRDRADDILARLEDGSMPCDGAWPPERVALFRSWRDQEFPRFGDGEPGRAGGFMTSYQDIVNFLDEAVGGSVSPVGAHGPFWRGKTRDEFVAALVFGQKLIMVGDGRGSNLVKALRGEAPFGSDIGTSGGIFRQMPAGRPPMASYKIDAVEQWIDAGCPG